MSDASNILEISTDLLQLVAYIGGELTGRDGIQDARTASHISSIFNLKSLPALAKNRGLKAPELLDDAQLLGKYVAEMRRLAEEVKDAGNDLEDSYVLQNRITELTLGKPAWKRSSSDFDRTSDDRRSRTLSSDPTGPESSPSISERQ